MLGAAFFAAVALVIYVGEQILTRCRKLLFKDDECLRRPLTLKEDLNQHELIEAISLLPDKSDLRMLYANKLFDKEKELDVVKAFDSNTLEEVMLNCMDDEESQNSFAQDSTAKLHDISIIEYLASHDEIRRKVIERLPQDEEIDSEMHEEMTDISLSNLPM